MRSVPTAASSHQRARRVRQACHAAAVASAANGATMLEFQTNVDALIADGLTAISRPATCPASGPATVLPSHHVAATPPTPTAASVATAATGFASVRNALGARIQ
ncbi:MAG TPA: hypothetical protein VF874_04395 [Mycobacterium sp.]